VNTNNYTLYLHDALPISTIKYLREAGAKVILISHLGRPKGEVVEELRLTPVAKRLSHILNEPIKKTDTVYGQEVTSEIDTLKNRSEEHTSELQSRFDLVC